MTAKPPMVSINKVVNSMAHSATKAQAACEVLYDYGCFKSGAEHGRCANPSAQDAKAARVAPARIS